MGLERRCEFSFHIFHIVFDFRKSLPISNISSFICKRQWGFGALAGTLPRGRPPPPLQSMVHLNTSGHCFLLSPEGLQNPSLGATANQSMWVLKEIMFTVVIVTADAASITANAVCFVHFNCFMPHNSATSYYYPCFTGGETIRQSDSWERRWYESPSLFLVLTRCKEEGIFTSASTFSGKS